MDIIVSIESSLPTLNFELLILHYVRVSSSASRSSAARRPGGRKGGVALSGSAARPGARLVRLRAAGWPDRCPALAGTWRCLPAHCAPAPAAPSLPEPAQELLSRLLFRRAPAGRLAWVRACYPA